jgi:hypothetical protein
MNDKHIGGPSHKKSEPPTANHDNKKIQSHDELTERTHEARNSSPGGGRRNGSSKNR